MRPVCRVPALQAEIALLRDVVVTLQMTGEDWCTIGWRPADGGPFPRFTGSLRVLGAEGGTWLRLDGRYDDITADRADPVDGALGFRLVQATASAFLDAVVAILHRPFSPPGDDERVTGLGESMQSPKSKAPAHPGGVDVEHRLEVEALEHAVHHETTQHAPKLHAQSVKATPLEPRSQQRRFPR